MNPPQNRLNHERITFNDLMPYVIPSALLEHDNETVFQKTSDLDYIIQPKCMMNAGSMCVTEFYSHATKL